MKSAYECFQSVDLISTPTNSLNEEVSLFWLVAKHGLETILNICYSWKSLPKTLTTMQSFRYISEKCNLPEVKVKELVPFIQLSCPSLLDKLPIQKCDPIVLAPPTSTCFQCGKNFVSNHSYKVRFYTEEGAYHCDSHFEMHGLQSILQHYSV